MKVNEHHLEQDGERVRCVLAHYENQTEKEAVAEDEATSEDEGWAMVEVPVELLPLIRELIARHQAQTKA